MRGKKAGWVVGALVVVALVGQRAGSDDPQQPGAVSDSAASASASPSVRPPAPVSTSAAPAEDATTAGPTAAPDATAPTSRTSRATPHSGTALAALAALRVQGRAPMTGYDRDRFGYAWLDADRNGCDTRNDILRRDLSATTLRPGTRDCVVLRGTLADPYTGEQIGFERGGGADVDIDHVVALGNAWVTGAFGWDVKKRAALANDPLNLLAVDAGANRQKGAGDAATWLPSHRAFRCAYVARQVAVKAKYALWVTAAEKAAIQRVLSGCPGQPLTPDRWRLPTRVDHDIHDPGPPEPAASPPAAPAPSAAQPRPLSGGSVYYENCTAARAAGAAPVHRGDPGYGKHLDRDGDGVGCE